MTMYYMPTHIRRIKSMDKVITLHNCMTLCFITPPCNTYPSILFFDQPWEGPASRVQVRETVIVTIRL